MLIYSVECFALKVKQ